MQQKLGRVPLAGREVSLPFEQSVGHRSKAVANVVEKGAVRKFAEAIGDPNPLYTTKG